MTLNRKNDDLAKNTEERFDLVAFKIDTLNDKIDALASDLKETDARLGNKIDAVAVNLKNHRADTEAHHGMYRVKNVWSRMSGLAPQVPVSLRYSLRSNVRKIKMMQQLGYSDMITHTVNVLNTEEGLQLAIIYGSVAAGNMRIDSDVDIALLFDRPLSAERKMKLAAHLEREFLRNVDLVDIATLSGTILKQILCKGRVLIQKETGIMAEQMQRMIYNQADMMPYVSRTLMERQQRFING